MFLFADGVVRFVFPVSLVTCNDIAAYFFGCLFGRTPLIRVSPRKTWEGFVGGFLATVMFGFFVLVHFMKFHSHFSFQGFWRDFLL